MLLILERDGQDFSELQPDELSVGLRLGFASICLQLHRGVLVASEISLTGQV